MRNQIKNKIGQVNVLILLTFITACNSNLRIGKSNAATSTNIDAGYEQIERLARPAVNEGLISTNANLNAFNSIPPSFDLMLSNPAILAVVSEAGATLTAVANLGIVSDPDDHVQRIVNGFLPDVLRIDTSVAISGSAYNGAVGIIADPESDPNQDAPILAGGRKLTDDVIDITLSYLAAGDPTGAAVGDGVSYSPDHDAVLSSFPFVPDPN